jgi:hypothetical protein
MSSSTSLTTSSKMQASLSPPISSMPGSTAPGSVPARRLSVRRGSVSAGDPYGKHPQTVQSSSMLTIVRVTSPAITPPAPDPSSSSRSSSPRRYRRLGSHSSPSASATSPDNTRLSFAFSSFAGPSPAPGGPANTSPSSSPRLRPSSPHRLSSLPSRPRLTPDQLLDLARSTDLRYSHSSSPSHSPLLGAQSPVPHTSTTTAPATFTPLPDYIHLPFIDRPSEVAALISSPPSAKLFSLLAQTFRDPSTPLLSSPEDPSKWTYAQLYEHLTTIPRSEVSDTLWVAQARKCILSHSELIWERIKGALGVPPELDVDHDLNTPPGDQHADDISSSTGSVDTDEISDDHGRSARGHWEDWDAVMDSPVFDYRHCSASNPPSPMRSRRPTVSDRGDPTFEGGSGLLSVSPTKLIFDPDSIRSPVSPSSFLAIEPILLPSNPISPTAPPPASLSSSETIGLMGLDDIQEGAEDESETDVPTPNEQTEGSQRGENEGQDSDLISPNQIQGLRISTTPVIHPSPSPNLLSNSNSNSDFPSAPPNSSSSISSYVAPSPISPLPPYPSTGTGGRSGSRSSSFSSLGLGSFRRSGSWGSLSGAPSSTSIAYTQDEEDLGYDPIGNRAPGNPLFPSNFSRLAAGPTLVAK